MAAKILRLICICLSVTAVLLCGCAKESGQKAEVELSFQADFTADYHGMQLAGSVVNTRQGVCALRFSAPETLDGLQLRSQNGVLTLRRGDKLATADEPYLPRESFPSLLGAMLTAAAKGEMGVADDGALTFSLPQGKATLTVDERRLPQSAEFADADCALRFSDARHLE